MYLTDNGILIDERDVHPSKHILPIDFTEFGIIIKFREEQNEKQ